MADHSNPYLLGGGIRWTGAELAISIGPGGSTGLRHKEVVAAASTSQVSQPLWMVCSWLTVSRSRTV
jgi:hypothetical protein